MSKDKRPIEVGDRFESKDKRDEGRVVEVTEADPSRVLGRERFWVQTEAHPKNPDAIGHVSRVSGKTIRAKYTRISR